jgi:UDP-3-O-[3-hydroxymyristoyl] glucosamine N-acyltransferase
MSHAISKTLQELAGLLGAKVQGDGDVRIHSIAPLSTAGEGQLTFVTNPKYLKALSSTGASAILLDKPPVHEVGKPLLLHPNPYACLARLLSLYHPVTKHPQGIRPGSFVHSEATVEMSACVMPCATVSAKAQVGARTVLYPGVYVGENAMIGEDCILYPNSVVADDCVLGDRVILQPGSVIGGDGFGFAPDAGAYLKIPQVGNVVLEDDVEIGANTTIDRAVMGSTKVGKGTKLDNLIQIGHNCQIGRHTVMAAMTGLAGSSNVGDHCLFGGNVGLAGHITIGDKVTLATRTGVMEDILEPGVYWGAPHQEMKDEMKCVATYRELPDLSKRLRRVEKALEKLDPSFKESRNPKEKP